MSLSLKRTAIGCGWCAVLILFFSLYSFIPAETLSGSIVRFSSPDETANYFFTKLYAETGQLTLGDEALAVSKNYSHPRSMTVVVDKIAPVSFVGLPVLYGAIASVTGVAVSVYFTPLLAILAIPFYILLVSRIFSKSVAYLSGLLLLIHPAYWYYASKSMMPNVLFVDLCIIGFSLLLWKKNFFAGLFGGLGIGLALFVRFSEAPWVLGIVGFLFLFYLLRHRLLHLLGCMIGLAAPLGLFFNFNRLVYGSPLLFGYQTIDTSSAVQALERSEGILSSFSFSRITELASAAMTIVTSFLPHILPFGFLPKEFSKNFLDYGVSMFWWLSLPIAFGILYALRQGLASCITRRVIDTRIPYLLIALAVSCWLVIFYGSWLFVDNITQETTIGNSYVRYWLPITVLTLPFAAQALVAIRNVSGGVVRSLALPLVFGAIVFYSFQSVLWDSPESLFSVAKNLAWYREKADVMMRLTPSDAIIFSQRSDKIFFPDRRAAVNNADFKEVPLLPDIVAQYPVYYYGLWDEATVLHLNGKYFKDVGLKLSYVASLDASERLYKVEVQ